LEYCENSIKRDLEQKYLDNLLAYDRNIGYNMSKNANSSEYEYTDDIRKKISDGVKKAFSEMSQESKEKMRQGSVKAGGNRWKNKTATKDFRRKRSEYMKNNPVFSTEVIRSDGMEFKTITDAANFCGVSRGTIRNWCKKGIKNEGLSFRIKE
jgi:hypothetical protein